MSVPSRRTRWLWVSASILVLGLSGCTTDPGQRAAERRLDEVADGMAREAQQNWRRFQTDPTWLAVWTADDSGPFSSGDDGTGELTVRPLAWRQLRDGDGEVEVSLDVTVPSHTAVSFGDRSRSGGHATACRRIRTDGTATALSCAGRSTPPVPSPPAIPDLDDRTGMIKTALGKPTIAAVRQYAQSKAGSFTMRADVVDDSWVLVLTRPKPYACLAGVRRPDGTLEIITPEPRVMHPGEGSCEPYAILHPVRTH